jgi:uncharacterized membrane protein
MSEALTVSRPAATQVRAKPRLAAVDALRGLIIAFMALDHTSLLVAQRHTASEIWYGVFPVYYDPLAFLTRLITHLCAPGFFLLMGAGMALSAASRRERGWTNARIARAFALRGGLLIAFQFLLENLAWQLSPGGWGVEIYVGVLFGLGTTMILTSALLWVPRQYHAPLGLVLLVGIQLLIPQAAEWQSVSREGLFGVLNTLFLYPGGTAMLWSNYPTLPWLGVTVLGFALGAWLRRDARQTYRALPAVAAGLLVLFVALRFLDGFGNIRPRMGNDWIDWLNMVKYPPSLTFLALTLGIDLLLLTLFSRVEQWDAATLKPLVVFGRVPLFFYIAHLFLYDTLGWLFTPNGAGPLVMYAFWLLGMALLYPACLLYAAAERRLRQRGAVPAAA